MIKTAFTANKFKELLKRAKWNKNGYYIAKAIAAIASPESALDLGCGTGRVLGALYDHCGCTDVFGVEGGKVKESLYPSIAHFVIYGDITQQLKLPHEPFDLVICTEVAEHIENADSEALVNNICDNCKKFVLFSAAPPGQRGTGHINCQRWEFWANLFAKKDFYVDPPATEQYRDALKQNRAQTIYITNGVILRKR